MASGSATSYSSFVNCGFQRTSGYFAGSFADSDKSDPVNDPNGGGCGYPNVRSTADLREIKFTGADSGCLRLWPILPPTSRPTPAPTPAAP